MAIFKTFSKHNASWDISPQPS